MRGWMALVALLACNKGGPAPDVDTGLPLDEVPRAADDAVPVTGGTLAISPDGTLAAVSDILGDRLILVDVAGGLVLGHVALEPGDRPQRLLVDDDGIVTAVLRRGGAVVQADLVQQTTTWRTDVCPSPRGIDRDGDGFWIACASGELVRLGADGQVQSSTFVEYDLRDVVVSDDVLYVSSFKKAQLLTLSRDGAVLDRRTPMTMASEAIGNVPSYSYSASVAWRTRAMPDGGIVMFHQRGPTS